VAGERAAKYARKDRIERRLACFHPYSKESRLKIRRIEPRDCFAALAEGYDDVVAMPTYPAFLGLF